MDAQTRPSNSRIDFRNRFSSGAAAVKYVKPALYLLAGCWLFGVGFRMVTQFMLSSSSLYPAQTPFMFDWWFDWLPMLPLGLWLIWQTFKDRKNLTAEGQ